MSKSLRGKGVPQSSKAVWIKHFARRCGATDFMSPHKGKPPFRTVSFAALWARHKGVVRQLPHRVSKARCRTFEAEDLFANFVQIVDARGSYSLRHGTRANGAYNSCSVMRPPQKEKPTYDTPLCKKFLSTCLFKTTYETGNHHPRRGGVAE